MLEISPRVRSFSLPSDFLSFSLLHRPPTFSSLFRYENEIRISWDGHVDVECRCRMSTSTSTSMSMSMSISMSRRRRPRSGHDKKYFNLASSQFGKKAARIREYRPRNVKMKSNTRYKRAITTDRD